jgi:hypothetical protein
LAHLNHITFQEWDITGWSIKGQVSGKDLSLFELFSYFLEKNRLIHFKLLNLNIPQTRNRVYFCFFVLSAEKGLTHYKLLDVQQGIKFICGFFILCGDKGLIHLKT